jgi:hypothetical protein
MKKGLRKFINVEIKNGEAVYYFRRDKGPRYRLPDDPTSDNFTAAYIKALKMDPLDYQKDRNPSAIQSNIREIESAVRTAVSKAKSRASRKGREFDIDSAWAIKSVRSNGYRCPLTGIKFLEPSGSSFMHPYKPSIDRIDNSLGYTKQNCRIVVFAINAMIADWGENVMHRVANGYRYQKNKKGRGMPLTPTQSPLTGDII